MSLSSVEPTPGLSIGITIQGISPAGTVMHNSAVRDMFSLMSTPPAYPATRPTSLTIALVAVKLLDLTQGMSVIRTCTGTSLASSVQNATNPCLTSPLPQLQTRA